MYSLRNKSNKFTFCFIFYFGLLWSCLQHATHICNRVLAVGQWPGELDPRWVEGYGFPPPLQALWLQSCVLASIFLSTEPLAPVLGLLLSACRPQNVLCFLVLGDPQFSFTQLVTSFFRVFLGLQWPACGARHQTEGTITTMSCSLWPLMVSRSLQFQVPLGRLWSLGLYIHFVVHVFCFIIYLFLSYAYFGRLWSVHLYLHLPLCGPETTCDCFVRMFRSSVMA